MTRLCRFCAESAPAARAEDRPPARRIERAWALGALADRRLDIVGARSLAKIVDWRMSRRELPPGAVTRYRVLRRSLMTTIVVVGILSALLVVPQVRAIAAGLLASSALVGLVVGLAAQRPLANFVAGVVIAFTSRCGSATCHRRRRRGHRRGDRPHLHVHQDPRQRAARDPEREAGLGYHSQLHHRQSGEARAGNRAGTARQRSGCGGRPAEERDGGRFPRRSARDRAERLGERDRAHLGARRGGRRARRE